MRNLSKNSNVIFNRNKMHDKIAVAVQLHRAASGGCVLWHTPSESWWNNIRQVSKENLGNICVVAHVTLDDHDGNYGIMLSIVPGNFYGKVGAHGQEFEEKRTDLYHESELCNYGTNGHGISGPDLSIETSLQGAIHLRDAINRVIRDARRLSAKEKKRKATYSSSREVA